MNTLTTDYGEVRILDHEGIYQQTLDFIKTTAETSKHVMAPVGLTGGSTPKAFYQWVAQHDALCLETASKLLWTTSDERCVPLDDDDNNFGHADREMLSPIGLPDGNKLPWPTGLEPEACAKVFNETWNKLYGPDYAFDLCFVGMGGDLHTLSLFPRCPLIKDNSSETFASTLWPERGWRVTMTVAGLSRCKQIVVSTSGAGKADALKEALTGDYDPFNKPIQLLREHAEKVTWLIDADAAASL
ncbi:MAG: 6-phosphogluconolactonase [Verrucomicrobiota bacterium]